MLESRDLTRGDGFTEAIIKHRRSCMCWRRYPARFRLSRICLAKDFLLLLRNDLYRMMTDSFARHTSQEARAVGLGYYKLSFGKSFSAKIGQSEVIMSTPARIYLHWEYDIICPMPNCLREEGCTVYCGSGPLVRELKDISPLMRRLALRKYDWSCIFDLLGSTALEEVMIYDEPITTFQHFEAHKSISLEFGSIENEVDEKLELGDQERLRLAKRLIEREIQRRQEEGSIRGFDKLPEGWVPPTVRLMRMVVKKGYEEADEEAIET
jgi:hypothetical protein